MTNATMLAAGADDRDLGGRDVATGGAHHVIVAADYPDGVLVVIACADTGEAPAALRELRPIGLDEGFVITPDPAKHRWPRSVQYEISPFPQPDQIGAVVDDVRTDSR